MKVKELKEEQLFTHNNEFYQRGIYAYSEAYIIDDITSEITEVYHCFKFSENKYIQMDGNTEVEIIEKERVPY